MNRGREPPQTDTAMLREYSPGSRGKSSSKGTNSRPSRRATYQRKDDRTVRRKALQVQRHTLHWIPMPASAESVLEVLRSRGLRMTPQRRAIVSEIMATDGHISPTDVARRVRERVPGVNPSTVYRTLDLLEELGVLSHAHLEAGAEYHRSSESEHVHLICSRCGSEDALSLAEAASLKRVIGRHHSFEPDFTHFAISGLCAECQKAAGNGRQRTAS